MGQFEQRVAEYSAVANLLSGAYSAGTVGADALRSLTMAYENVTTEWNTLISYAGLSPEQRALGAEVDKSYNILAPSLADVVGQPSPSPTNTLPAPGTPPSTMPGIFTKQGIMIGKVLVPWVAVAALLVFVYAAWHVTQKKGRA